MAIWRFRRRPRSVISVGAQRSRLSWTRADGKLASFDRELNRGGDVFFGGPLRDGRFAPDVLAPGEFIVSALSSGTIQSDPRSSFALPHDSGLLIADDGLHGVLRERRRLRRTLPEQWRFCFSFRRTFDKRCANFCEPRRCCQTFRVRAAPWLWPDPPGKRTGPSAKCAAVSFERARFRRGRKP